MLAYGVMARAEANAFVSLGVLSPSPKAGLRKILELTLSAVEGIETVEQVAVETLKHIADQLIQARTARSMTLDEVATKTYIPLRTLKALEAAEPYNLPESVFVQGFIKRYADLVGLDGKTLSQEFEQARSLEWSSAVPLQTALETSTQTVTVVPPQPAALPEDPRTPPRLAQVLSRPKPLLLVLGGMGGLLLVLAAIVLLPRQLRPTVPTTSQSPSPTPPTTKPLATTAIASNAKSTRPKPTSPKPAGTVNISVNLSDTSWLEVIADGNVKFEGELKKGATQSWSANKEIEISSGNAGAVTVVHNQQPPVVMGGLGQVRTLKFSANP